VAALVLASRSPRRAWLLQRAGVVFDVDVPAVDERHQPPESPPDYALRLARAKRDAVTSRRPGVVVLAADTVVALDGEVLEKPRDQEDACRMLRALSGRCHQVHTAVAAGGPAGQAEGVVTAAVSFRALGDKEIASYVATGEPMDKAGAYGIQGDGGALVDRVEGSYTCVVGLPLKEALELVRQVGEAS
jgi:septum formation protein